MTKPDTTKPLALVVDDEPDIRELLQLTLSRMEVETRAAQDLGEAQDLLTQYPFNLCLTDMRLPDGNGIELVKHMQQNYPHTPVAVITAHGNMESAVGALKAGAFDFVSKPVDLQVLRNLVSTALKLSDRRLEREKRSRYTLLGDSPAMQAIRGTIVKLARSQAPIYISGESGTGKELVARLIHEKGPRADKPFVPVNCGAVPEGLMESEFFGHRKGSFTGATKDNEGLFQAANGGTLFLDEVADLPQHMQVKLLRTIQERTVRPIGDQREIPIDARILCATHKDLNELVQEGHFRQDLFYRLNVIELHIPNLRKRREDIGQLAEHILERLCRAWGNTTAKLAEDALETLREHDFPGNVRELENILERAMTLSEGDIIHAADLHLPSTSAAVSEPSPAPERNGLDLETYLEHIEKDTILKALEATRFNKTAAAKKLGISFRALRYRLEKLGIR